MEATRAARTALKPLKLDPVRQARGRGQAVAITPDQIRRMNTAIAAVSVPAVAVLALTGHPDQATAVGVVGGAVATAGGIQITVNIRR